MASFLYVVSCPKTQLVWFLREPFKRYGEFLVSCPKTQLVWFLREQFESDGESKDAASVVSKGTV